MTAIQQKPSNMRQLLNKRDFRSVFMGGLISDIGTYFTLIALIFLVIQIGISQDMSELEITQATALVITVQLIPSLLLGPFAGVLVDRFDRKKIMILSDL